MCGPGVGARPAPDGGARHGGEAAGALTRRWYLCTTVHMSRSRKPGPAPTPPESPLVVERVQTGVRMEKRILKVLKALADYHDITLGDLLEGIVLHAFEGKAPFGGETLRKIADLKRVFGLDLGAGASHRLREDRREDEDDGR